MNISTISNSLNLTNVNNNKQVQKVDTASSATKTQIMPKPDAMSSATITNGEDHHFEAKA
jgi:uncharacterized protein (DUF4213/DUF364 family)